VSTVIPENKPFLHQKASVINPGIHLIGIVNNKGRMVDSIGTGFLNVPKDKEEMFLMGITLLGCMQNDFNEDFGEVNYNITQRGRAKFISIPINNGNTILAIVNKDADHERIIADIKHMQQYSNHFLGEKLSNERGGT